MTNAERRKDHRYVVEGVCLIVAGESYPVIDLSVGGARIACRVEEVLAGGGAAAILEFAGRDKTEQFKLPVRIIRYTELYVVIGYDAPRGDWEDFIRHFDTFHVNELETALFG